MTASSKPIVRVLTTEHQSAWLRKAIEGTLSNDATSPLYGISFLIVYEPLESTNGEPRLVPLCQPCERLSREQAVRVSLLVLRAAAEAFEAAAQPRKSAEQERRQVA